MSIKTYLPSVERISVEIIATACGVLGAAFLISRFPKLKAFVDGNSIWAVSKPDSGV
ncbi:hypothetical protein [Burkholderia sp. Tr-20390]|uniref:hypothetical protein n=1 Tax=Burkholderia sp. Tr-20390 TaxID=2703904 RepID=UPI00197F03BC|nr:hypothetical protein [Burkholderia sp. Tr-20390]MBN3734648.1 hypothetical protein [Burkholderia sp. Tr-20390]